MTGSMAARSKKGSEKDLYVPKQTLLYNTKKPELHSGIAKKRGIMTLEKNSLEIDEKEAALVSIAVKSMMKDVKSGKTKTYKLDEVLEEENKRRGLR